MSVSVSRTFRMSVHVLYLFRVIKKYTCGTVVVHRASETPSALHRVQGSHRAVQIKSKHRKASHAHIKCIWMVEFKDPVFIETHAHFFENYAHNPLVLLRSAVSNKPGQPFATILGVVGFAEFIESLVHLPNCQIFLSSDTILKHLLKYFWKISCDPTLRTSTEAWELPVAQALGCAGVFCERECLDVQCAETFDLHAVTSTLTVYAWKYKPHEWIHTLAIHVEILAKALGKQDPEAFLVVTTFLDKLEALTQVAESDRIALVSRKLLVRRVIHDAWDYMPRLSMHVSVRARHGCRSLTTFAWIVSCSDPASEQSLSRHRCKELVKNEPLDKILFVCSSSPRPTRNFQKSVGNSVPLQSNRIFPSRKIVTLGHSAKNKKSARNPPEASQPKTTISPQSTAAQRQKQQRHENNKTREHTSKHSNNLDLEREREREGGRERERERVRRV